MWTETRTWTEARAGTRGRRHDAQRAVRLGVFGGTFDPPHAGHLVVAQDVVEALSLDRLLFVPSAIPPHRSTTASAPAELRLAMTEAAVEGEDRFRVSDVEFKREGPSYTVDTLRELTRLHADAELYFLMGADQFARFDTWKEPAEVAQLARIVVMERRGELEERAPLSGIDFETVPVLRIDLSSTDVRARVKAGRSIRYRVPEGVRRIIEDHNLYLT